MQRMKEKWSSSMASESIASRVLTRRQHMETLTRRLKSERKNKQQKRIEGVGPSFESLIYLEHC